MPAQSPVSDITELILSLSIKVNKKPLPDAFAIVSAHIFHEINRISYAEIVIAGDTIESSTHPVTDGDDLNPGNEIEIFAGFGSKSELSVFKGVIVKHGIDVSPTSMITLNVTCKHKAISMTFNKTEAEHAAQTDSDIISAIIGSYNLVSSVDATTPLQENMFQKQATDWDFILSRAEFFGFLVTMDGNAINVGKPKLTASPVLRLAIGDSIQAFNAELNAEKQVPGLDASAWDIKTQTLIKETAEEPGMNDQGNVLAKALSGKLSQKKSSLISAAPMSSEELKAWATGNLLRIRLSALKGQVTFIGSALVKTGDIIELEGVGAKFNGKAFVSSVNHILEQGKWKTKVKFGLDTKYMYEKNDFSYPAAGGRLPAISGLHVATVQKIFDDPESNYRVLVNIPSNAGTQTGFWARLCGLYATSGAGAFFFPEVGDEVIIGFLDNDPRFPVIVGSVYSSKLKSPVEPAENNYMKSLITKAQLKINFDDENKIITISTPGNNTIAIDDKEKTIELKDQNKNSVKLSPSGVDITSDKDVTISAQNITLSAKAAIKLSAKADVNIEGLNVKLTAKAALAAKGAQAELIGSAQTTIKGAMVMIN